MSPYRADIDGLRGLAVLLVVLYHAGFGCPGGYLGVDVFLVISGFLITSILRRQIQAGEFRFGRFWEARIRRLGPGLAVMLTATILAASWLLAPAYQADFMRSVLAQACLVSNVYFWKTTSYWDAAVELKALLHTWSLAVEEQFYLVYPILLWLLRRRDRAALVLLTLIIVSSFGLGMLHQDQRATFFLLPMRAWELAAGALLAYLPPLPGEGLQRELLSGLGLALIVTPALLLAGGSSPYPSLAALAPCWGTAVLIASYPTRIHRLLSHRALVTLGLLSYSWYLLHWPALALGRAGLPAPLSLQWRILIVLGSLLLAFLSWRLIEQPIRTRRFLPSRNRFLGWVACFWMALVGAAAGGWWLGSRLESAAQPAAERPRRNAFHEPLAISVPWDEWDALTTDLASASQGRFHPAGLADSRLPVSFVLWGDSHGAALHRQVHRAAQNCGRRGYSALKTAIVPLVDCGWGAPGQQREQRAFNQAVLDFIRRERVPKVILTSYWDRGLRGDPNFAGAMRRTLELLEQSGCEVWFIQQIPILAQPAPQALHAALKLGRDPFSIGISRNEYLSQTASVDELLRRFRQPNTHVMDPGPLFFERGERSLVIRDGELLYYDKDHLTERGAQLLYPFLLDVIGSE